MTDVKVGVDGLAFVEKALIGHNLWTREEGVPPTFGDDLRKLVADTLAAENAARLVVVFDGLCNTTVLEAAKSRAAEDVLLWAANFLGAESAPSAIAKLPVDVLFAPYLAAPQLLVLQADGVIARVVPSLCGLHLQPGREHELAAFAPCLSYTAGGSVRLRVTNEEAPPPPPDVRVAIADQFGRHALGLKNPLYYLLLAAGVCSPALLRIIAQRRITVEETAEKVREIEGYMMPLRAQIAFQFPLIRDIHKDSLRPEDPQVLAGMQNPPIIELDPWDLSRENVLPQVHLLSVLQAYHACAVQVPTQEMAPQHVLPVILLRSMDLMGYFTHNSSERDGEENVTDVSSCSVFGQALAAVNEVTGDVPVDPALIDAAFVLIELIRTEGIAVDGTADDDTMARKLASLVPVTVRCVRAKDMKSPGEFIGAAQMIRRLLRQLVESIAAGVLQTATVTGQQRLTGAALNEIAMRLPFTAVPSNRGAMLYLHTSMFGTAVSGHFVGSPNEDVWRRDFANLNLFARMVLRIIQTFQDEEAFIDGERLDEVRRGAAKLHEATKQYVQ